MDEKNQELQSSFREWVNAGIDLVKPWRVALIVTNLCWAFVLALFIWLAYMTPDTTYQCQDFETSTQTQAAGEYDPSMAPNN